MRSERARQLLTELMPRLLEALAKTANPDAAFARFNEFLARLPAGVQLFSLFHAYPTLLDLVAEIMGDAPRLDRKSVVWGKSVSVRVDLGGRGIIKNKTN